MKIAAFGVRDDEIPYFKQWTEATGDEIACHREFLTPTTATLAQGAEGVTCFQTVPYEAAVFQAMRELKLPWLALRNTGVDNVDFSAAAKAGIRVSNVPAYSPAAIAEFALADMLYLLRQTGAVQADLHQHHYEAATRHIGRELNQCTVGVVGTGRIGRTLIHLLNGLGASVLAFDPHHNAQPGLHYEEVDFPELLRRSDIVSLHIPGTPANHHLINAAALAMLKPGALLINTGRPNLMDTTAIIAALQAGTLGGVGIDTYEHETEQLLALSDPHPTPDPQWETLLAMPNVILSPHIAYYTQTAVQHMVETALQALKDFKHRQSSQYELSPELKQAL